MFFGRKNVGPKKFLPPNFLRPKNICVRGCLVQKIKAPEISSPKSLVKIGSVTAEYYLSLFSTILDPLPAWSALSAQKQTPNPP